MGSNRAVAIGDSRSANEHLAEQNRATLEAAGILESISWPRQGREKHP